MAYVFGEPAAAHRPAGYTTALLTRRQREVAQLVAKGLTNKQIAAHLTVSQRTADSHVEHILTKLGFTSRTQVVSWFFTAGPDAANVTDTPDRRGRYGPPA